MRIRQVFAAYDYQRNQPGLSEIQFCVRCGTRCSLREDAGRLRPVCPWCGWVDYKNPTPAVSVLIIDKDRVLLGKRGPRSTEEGKWCLPCGFMEFDEDFITAARREVKEETGVSVAIDSIVNVAFNYLSPGLHALVIVMTAHIVSGELKPGDDIIELEWFPVFGLLPEMAFEADVVLIERYRRGKLQGIPVQEDLSGMGPPV